MPRITETSASLAATFGRRYSPRAAAERLLRKLDAGEDATWLNFGDSLSDAQTDWAYLLAVQLGAIFPGHTVKYQTATTSGWFGSEATLQVGTGSGTLTVRNAAVGGYGSDDWTATIEGSLLTGITPDLVTVFLSHNDSNVEATFKASFTALLDAIAAEWATSPVVVGVQNESTTQPTYTQNHRQWILDLLATRPTIAVTEAVWDAFGATTPIAAYYVDNVHPTTAGVLALKNAWADALGVPGDAVSSVATAAVAPLLAQLAAVTAQFNPFTLLSWVDAYWAGDPDWTDPGDAGAVTSWRDGGVSATPVVQGTGAKQPTYRASTAAFNSRPTIEFVSANDTELFYDIPTLAQPFTLVVVGMSNDVLSRAFVDVNSSGASNAYYAGINATSGAQWQIHQGTTLRGGTPEANVPVLFIGTFDGSSSSIVVNGVTVASGDAGTSGAAEMRIGISSTGAATTAPLDGHIAFVGLYDGDITADNGWLAFQAWAASHYGISVA